MYPYPHDYHDLPQPDISNFDIGGLAATIAYIQSGGKGVRMLLFYHHHHHHHHHPSLTDILTFFLACLHIIPPNIGLEVFAPSKPLSARQLHNFHTKCMCEVAKKTFTAHKNEALIKIRHKGLRTLVTACITNVPAERPTVPQLLSQVSLSMASSIVM